jgi:integrase/recombinase XerD
MHSISDPSRVRFTGPLAPFAAGLAEELVALGYTRASSADQLRLAAHLSRWLDAGGLGPADLSGPVLARFLLVRRASYTARYSLAALDPILGGGFQPTLRILIGRVRDATSGMEQGTG